MRGATRCLLASLLLLHLTSPARSCTTIVISPGASSDGAAYASSTADCLDCDFRLARVPPRAHAAGARRDVYHYKSNYPHVVDGGRAATWAEANLEGDRARVRKWAARSRKRRIGAVDEVARTYALIEAGSGYGLLNEKMVGMGESTCLAKFAATPRGHGGEALLDISELGKIAMERVGSAREAVLLMGELAERFGYYGAEWDTENRLDEAGENLMVTDPYEAWVFHILPDDTGKSAIWAAQRVPDGHITVVANQFIIRKIDSTDKKNFLHSENMLPIAVKHGFHDPKRDGKYLDFTKCFSGVRPHSSYTTHRVYTVYTRADPSLVGKLDPYPSALMDGYPFSVKPARPLTVADIFRMNRDHYEGTPWDMTRTAAAQPFGDPDRYDIGALGNFTTHQVAEAGEFGRAISIGRTSYTAVARSTRRLPADVGAMLYYAQQQPDSSVFVPVYVAAEKIPKQLTVGTLFEFNPDSMFWSVTAVSNWVHRYYKHAIGDVRKLQREFEEKFAVDKTDAAALRLMKAGRHDEARAVLSDFSNSAAAAAHEMYTTLFPKLIARFHDGFFSTFCLVVLP